MGNEEWKATRPAVVTPTLKGIANVLSVEPKCHGKRHDQRGQPRNLSRQSPKLRVQDDATKAGGGNLHRGRGATAWGREEWRRRRDRGRRGQPPQGTGSHCLEPKMANQDQRAGGGNIPGGELRLIPFNFDKFLLATANS